MSGKFLLDTNIVVALFGGDPSVQEKLKKKINPERKRITLDENQKNPEQDIKG
jgi:predicted nucleic acid-binding protein